MEQGMGEVVGKWQTSRNAKLQSSAILPEKDKIFWKENSALSLQLYHARAKVSENILGVYALQIIGEHFPQAVLDVSTEVCYIQWV
jgi:hypothetical protein